MTLTIIHQMLVTQQTVTMPIRLFAQPSIITMTQVHIKWIVMTSQLYDPLIIRWYASAKHTLYGTLTKTLNDSSDDDREPSPSPLLLKDADSSSVNTFLRVKPCHLFSLEKILSRASHSDDESDSSDDDSKMPGLDRWYKATGSSSDKDSSDNNYSLAPPFQHQVISPPFRTPQTM